MLLFLFFLILPESNISSFYAGIRDADKLSVTCHEELESIRVITAVDSILYLWSKGLIYSKSDQQNRLKAFDLFKLAHDISIQSDNNEFRRETDKKILSVLFKSDYNEDLIEYYIEDFKNLVYSKSDTAYFNYFNRYNSIVSSFISDKSFRWANDQFEEDILYAHDVTLLKTNFYILRAYYHELIKENITKAIEYYEKAIIEAKSIDQITSDHISFIVVNNLALLYEKKGDYKLALKFYQDALSFENMPFDSYSRVIINSSIATCLKEVGNYELAYNRLNKAFNLERKYQNKTQLAQIQEIQAKYDNEKLQRSITEQNLQLSQRQLYILALSSLSLLLAGGWLFYRRRADQRLETQRRAAQINAMNARLDGEEQERIRVAQVLHDSIASQLTAVDFQLTALKSQVGERAKIDEMDKSVSLIRSASTQVRDLSHELVPPVLLKLGIIPAIEDLCIKYSNGHVNFTVVFNKVSLDKTDRNFSFKLYLVLQELLQNILKHSDASKVQISFHKDSDQLVITIEDNGTRAIKTDESAGLITIRTRLNSLGGHFDIKRVENEGVNIQYLTAPINRET